jgi:hypothetical protein
LHLLHRHGARYPNENGKFLYLCYYVQSVVEFVRETATYGNPADFAGRLHKAAKKWTAKGDLKFMNDWYVIFLSSPYSYSYPCCYM